MAIAELFLGLYNHRGTADFSEDWELGAIASLFPLNFDETGNQIKAILEKRYTDGISGFESVKVDGSKITGVFSDIVSPSLTKKFNFSIDSDTGDVDYTQIDTGSLDKNFSEYNFAAPASKSKQCKEGKSSACTRQDGSTYCIKIGYKCKSVGLNGEELAVVKAIVEKSKKTQPNKIGVASEIIKDPAVKKTDKAQVSPTPTDGEYKSISDRQEAAELYKGWLKSPAFKTLNNFQELDIAKRSLEFARQSIKNAENSTRSQYQITTFDTGFPEVRKFTKEEYLVYSQKEITSNAKKVQKLEKALSGVELSVDSDRLGAALTIYEEISRTIKNKKMSVGGVKDKNGDMSAIYITSKKDDALYLEFLVTSPENLIKGKAQKGAGTAAIENLIDKSKEMGSEGKIKLFALDNAIPFYRKIGFTNDDGENSETMTLSPESANKFIENRRKQ